MSDLPSDMEEEVLSRLPVTYLGELRSTCKKWKPSTKGGGFSKKRQRKGTEVVMMVEHRVPLTSVDLLYPSIGNLDAGGVDISKLSHWWIEPINSYHRWDSYALGYDKEKHKAFGDTVTLSSVRQEQLAVLFQKYGAPGTGGVVKIWITNKIDPNAVSWSNLFLAVDTKPVIGLRFNDSAGSFFVDEEKKVAAVLDKCFPPTRNTAYFNDRVVPKMSDLPSDMEEEVLSRLPMTSLGKLRSTCKKWNTLTKSESFIRRRQRKGIEVVMLVENRVSLMSVDLLSPSIEPIGNLDAGGVDISNIFHCDGLFLCCITKAKDKDSSRLVVWNPYLGQTRWIEPSNSSNRWEKYALGYAKEKKQHKVLRFVNNYDPSVKRRVCEFEVYSLSSNSWKVIDDFTPDWRISFKHSGLTLKGNAYWYAQEKLPLVDGPISKEHPDFLLCFDFTRERFGPRLPLPFHGYGGDTVTLSSVREEQLAVLFQKYGAPGSVVKIWITNRIEPNAVSWSNLLLAVDMKPVIGLRFKDSAGSFFVDEEKKVAAVLDKVILDKDRGKTALPTGNIAHMIGNNGYLKKVDIGECINKRLCYPLVCSYVPSAVQVGNTP